MGNNKKIEYITLSIPKNRKWTKVITVKNKSTLAVEDLTGATITAQVRETPEEGSDLVKAITITHNDAGGVMTLVMDNSSTPVTVDKGYVDIVFTFSGVGYTWASGPVNFTPLPTSL